MSNCSRHLVQDSMFNRFIKSWADRRDHLKCDGDHIGEHSKNSQGPHGGSIQKQKGQMVVHSEKRGPYRSALLIIN